MGKKIVLILLVLIAVLVVLFMFVLVPNMKSNPVMDENPNAITQLLNTAAYATVSDLTTEGDYQKIWEEASKNMAKKKSFQVEWSNEEDPATMKVNNEEFSIFFGEEMIQKGGYSYFGTKGEGVKTKADSEAAISWLNNFDIDEFKDSIIAEEWDGEDMEYRGIEVVGGKKYHLFHSTYEELTLWIDALAILPVKFEGPDTLGTITYGSVRIEAPDNYEDISNLPTEEQEMRILEIFFTGIEDDWMMEEVMGEWDGEDIDWEDEDLLRYNYAPSNEFVQCLADAGMVIYGSSTCPACRDLVEYFGGKDIIQPLYVECTDFGERCSKETQTNYVPEIQINGEVFQGQRNFQDFENATGCEY